MSSMVKERKKHIWKISILIILIIFSTDVLDLRL